MNKFKTSRQRDKKSENDGAVTTGSQEGSDQKERPTIPRRETSLLWGPSNSNSDKVDSGHSISSRFQQNSTLYINSEGYSNRDGFVGGPDFFIGNFESSPRNSPPKYNNEFPAEDTERLTSSTPEPTSIPQNSSSSSPNESFGNIQSSRQKLGLITDVYTMDRNNYILPSSPDTPSQENDTFPSESTFSFYDSRRRYGRGHSHSLSIDSTMSIDHHPVVYSFSRVPLATTHETNEDSTPELTPNLVTPIDTSTQRSPSSKTPFFTDYSLSPTFDNISPVSSSGKSSTLIESPPRKLLLQSSMLQIIGISSLKERYLFLFNDLLIIAKLVNANPQKSNIPPTEKLYQVKDIIEMHQITHITLPPLEDRDASLINKAPKREPSVMATFSRKFSTDPHGAITDLIERRHIKNDSNHIAALLFKRSELSKRQLGLYLSDRKKKEVMIAFLDKFRFEGLYIDEALRVFLMSVCLPPEQEAFDYLIKSFANRWYNANANVVKFNENMSMKLTFAMLDLNRRLHEQHHVTDNQNVKKISRNDTFTLQDFLNQFRRESYQLVSDELLEKLYSSIHKEKLEFACDDTLEDISLQIPIKVHPARWPTRLTLLTPSDPITITIPHPDPHFAIKLHGQDLTFNPPFLDFTHTNSCTFTIKGETLGLHSMVLIKSGTRCRNYINLPSTKTMMVERAFMKWTFQITFAADNGIIRNYRFSADSQEHRRVWVETIKALVEKLLSNSLSSPKFLVIDDDDKEKEEEEEDTTRFTRSPASQVDSTKAAEAVALRILKDALIPSENAIREFTNTVKDRSSPVTNALENISNGNPTVRNSIRNSGVRNSGIRNSVVRNSVVRNSVRNSMWNNLNLVNTSPPVNPFASYAKTGDEIINMAVQNSLLPFLVGFFTKHLETDTKNSNISNTNNTNNDREDFS
ncbi:hypothetical protein C2G38_2110371 [Gigaspora rosea]|uniref:SEC7 domain-containing protein n=1 Tax=Gigaspora rosea TaxID=44941 RepID=A0A397UIZ5_9GLOM|nr:hypothetical protein C2G38_2110371 [Gigaspora rosea]